MGTPWLVRRRATGLARAKIKRPNIGTTEHPEFAYRESRYITSDQRQMCAPILLATDGIAARSGPRRRPIPAQRLRTS